MFSKSLWKHKIGLLLFLDTKLSKLGWVDYIYRDWLTLLLQKNHLSGQVGLPWQTFSRDFNSAYNFFCQP